MNEMSIERLEALAEKHGAKIVYEPTSSDIVCGHANAMRRDAHLLMGAMKDGGRPDEIAIHVLKITRAYIDLVLDGKIPDAASAYSKAMEDAA